MDRKVGASSRSHRRRAAVRGKALLGVVAGRPGMLSLSRYRSNMPRMSSRLFFGVSARVDSAVTAVVAGAVRRLVHSGVVNVVDDIGVDPIHRGVVEKMPILPASAFITMPEVSKAIVDPAVETN